MNDQSRQIRTTRRLKAGFLGWEKWCTYLLRAWWWRISVYELLSVRVGATCVLVIGYLLSRYRRRRQSCVTEGIVSLIACCPRRIVCNGTVLILVFRF